MKIPKSFKLFATTVNVVVDNKRTDDMKVFGCYEPHNNTIVLADKFGIHDISEDQMLNTFYHEKVHAILRAMNEEELNDNEKFVDVFAKLLRQSDETITFDTNQENSQDSTNGYTYYPQENKTVFNTKEK